MHKFLQQILASAAAGKTLAFSSYGDQNLAKELRDLLDEIDGQTLMQIYNRVMAMEPPVQEKFAWWAI